MSEVIECHAGEAAQLAVTATDGRQDLYLRATIFNGNGSPIPVAAVNLDHRMIGFYRGSVTLSGPGIYRAVYRNFLDAGRTILDPDREHDQDTIIVRPLDVPLLGVAYDDITDQLRVEVTLSRNGHPMPAAELLAAAITVYDSDNHAILAVSDLAPDPLGVFRFVYDHPGLVSDRLYYTRVVVTTTSGAVEANKGFQTTE